MVFLFVIRASGSELDGETFTIQDTDAVRAGVRAAHKVDDTFSLASPARRASARAEYVATFPSRRAYEAAEESGVSLTPAMADAVLDVCLGEELRACKRHDFRDGDVCSRCDAMRGAA